ncbi:MAG TPA: hypothetical protein VNS79_02065 [Sphingobium sp.]|nr:hypothetical protein [Sphingobium sp.]
MPGSDNQMNPSQNGADRHAAGQARSPSGPSADWLAKLRESDPGWDEPAFAANATARPYDAASISEQTMGTPHAITPFMPEPEADPFVADAEIAAATDTPSRPRAIALAGLGLAAILWLGAIVWTLIDPAAGVRLAPVLLAIASWSVPLVLLAALAMLLLLGGRREAAAAQAQATHAQALAGHATQAAARLGDVQAQFLTQTRSVSATADQSAAAILDAMRTMQGQSARLDQGTTTAIATLTTLDTRIAAMTDALPRLEDRLATLGETLSRLGGELGQRHDALDQQLQATALVTEEARAQLVDAGTQLAGQLANLKNGAQQAGEELAGLSELSSARVDLTLERMQSVMSMVGQHIEAQGQALDQLVASSRAGIESTATQALDHYAGHCRKVESLLTALDSRLTEQADKSGTWLNETATGVGALADQFDTLERSALARAAALSASMSQLSDETGRLTAMLGEGHVGADGLIQRAESLLVALDSGIRELDESVPNALGRVETRLDTLQERIRSTAPGIEAVEAVAAGVVSQLHESDQLARSHATLMTEAADQSQAALAAQTAQVAALAAAVATANEDMARLGDTAGPRMIEALLRVRETADAAATRARSAIGEAIPEAAKALATASGQAMEQAVSQSVAAQIERLSLVADDAVKAAHHATDELTRRMESLAAASKALEDTLAEKDAQVDGQGREQMAQRSAHLIAALNEHAIDVGKWLDRDVTDAEWAAYLKGEQGLFARRALKLATGAEAKQINLIYTSDTDFRENVNRYVHDFEALLRTVLATREGSMIALTMVSSDIGKLYVALAQAIDRLRPQA